MWPTRAPGVFSQREYPGHGPGPLDDCWCVADLRAVHAIAPWLPLPKINEWRVAAGVPDSPTEPDGANVAASAKAMRAYYPGLTWTVSNGTMSAAQLIIELQNTRVASLSVLSAALPEALRFGFTGPDSRHRVTVCWDGTTIRLANGLAKPHAGWGPITPAQLTAAIQARYADRLVRAVLTPTVEDAFATHPLLPAAIAKGSTELVARLQAWQTWHGLAPVGEG